MKYFMLIFLLLIVAIGQLIGEEGDIQVVGVPTLLVHSEDEYFMAPQWSPDGSMIAFTGYKYTGIRVMELSTGTIRKITDDIAAGFGFQWSHDSKAIVARVARYDDMRRMNAIKVFDIETGEEFLITDYRPHMPGLPQWSKTDYNIFLFSRGKLEVFDWKSRLQTESGREPLTLEKGPTDRRIIFSAMNNIAVGDIETMEYRYLIPDDDNQYINVTPSPDGTKIAFEVLGGNMYVMNVDGTGLVDLGRGHRPHWSPDGEYITYMITEDDGHNFISSEIFVIRVDGTNKVQITDSDEKIKMNPVWSPDGNKIAFDVLDEGAIYYIEIAR